jgi:hypothetical protein
MVRLPAAFNDPAPDSVPVRRPPLDAVTVLPLATARLPPLKFVMVVLPFTETDPSVRVPIALFSPFKVNVPPTALSVTRFSAPPTVVEPPPEMVPKDADSEKFAEAPVLTVKSLPAFSEPAMVNAPAVTVVPPS